MASVILPALTLLIAAWHVHGALSWRGRIRLAGSLRRWLSLELEIDCRKDPSER